jgi:hypothetical protein
MKTGPKSKSIQPGSNYEEEIPKGRKPVDHKTVRKPNDTQPILPPKSKNPAKTRELEEQPVSSIDKPPKKD